jgi:hypothetical protein
MESVRAWFDCIARVNCICCGRKEGSPISCSAPRKVFVGCSICKAPLGNIELITDKEGATAIVECSIQNSNSLRIETVNSNGRLFKRC